MPFLKRIKSLLDKVTIVAGALAIILAAITAIFLQRLADNWVSDAAIRSVQTASSRGNVEKLSQDIFSILCISERHSFCSVEIIDHDGELVSRIPNFQTPPNRWVSNNFEHELLSYEPPLRAKLTTVPSLASFVYWLGFGSIVGFLFFLIALFFTVKSAIVKAEKQMEVFKWQLASNEANAELGKISTQVAHDIRSPLAALLVLEKEMAALPDSARQLYRMSVDRIRNIASDLLEKHKSISSQRVNSICSMPLLLGDVISEKRLEYKDRANIEILFEPDPNSIGLFADINSYEFKRVVSNIVNNSVDAIEGRGTITIGLLEVGKQILIFIRDDGKGIPTEILTQLKGKGFSFEKPSGSGLGLFHAQNYLAARSGHLKIESKIGQGTTVTIILPRVSPPAWFPDKIVLEKNSNVVVVDDDESFYRVWERRFYSLDLENNGIKLFYFKNPDSLRAWLSKQMSSAPPKYFLIDFEYSGSNENGIDLITSLDIAKQSLLVTSRYEDIQVISKVTELGVQLLPKGLANFLPFEIKN